jgi:hypothetical protein
MAGRGSSPLISASVQLREICPCSVSWRSTYAMCGNLTRLAAAVARLAGSVEAVGTARCSCAIAADVSQLAAGVASQSQYNVIEYLEKTHHFIA